MKVKKLRCLKLDSLWLNVSEKNRYIANESHEEKYGTEEEKGFPVRAPVAEVGRTGQLDAGSYGGYTGVNWRNRSGFYGWLR